MACNNAVCARGSFWISFTLAFMPEWLRSGKQLRRGSLHWKLGFLKNHRSTSHKHCHLTATHALHGVDTKRWCSWAFEQQLPTAHVAMFNMTIVAATLLRRPEPTKVKTEPKTALAIPRGYTLHYCCHEPSDICGVITSPHSQDWTSCWGLQWKTGNRADHEIWIDNDRHTRIWWEKLWTHLQKCLANEKSRPLPISYLAIKNIIITTMAPFASGFYLKKSETRKGPWVIWAEFKTSDK